MDRVKSKRLTQARRVSFVFTALSFAVTALSVQASVTPEAWVSTKTKVFHLPAATPTGASIATDAALARTLASTQKVSITVVLKPHNEAQLDQQVAFAQSGGSRQFLTPEQFTTYYGAPQADVDKVVAHLKKSGYSDISVSPNRLFISAKGTAANVKTAFNASLQGYQKGKKHVYANTTDAQVPASLSHIIEGVLGLQSAVTSHTYHHLVSEARTASVPTVAADGLQTNAATTQISLHDPLDFGLIYGGPVANLSQGYNTSVGIISWGDVSDVKADLDLWFTKRALPNIPVTVVNVGTGDHIGNDLEWQLDSQAIVGAARGRVKELIIYNSAVTKQSDGSYGPANDDILAAMNKVVTDNKVKIVNMSFGESEGDESYRAAENTVFKQGVLQGITFSASAGDEGAYEDSTGVPAKTTSVSLPATSPYVVSVGGTELTTVGTDAYSGETTWNEGLSFDDSLNANRIWSTGGGFSAYEPAPSWQPKTLTGSTFRAIPDVAFDASGTSGAIVYYHGKRYGVGGTSLASPIFVGLWSRIQTVHKNALGFPITSIYKYFPTATTAGVHDVTVGNNGVTGSPSFSAAKGWDPVTGFGSFNALSLLKFINLNPDFAK
ncbi:protease pro-enzyme activation domain-containing protein [Aquirhabdus sp.]|uniref:S53 family peptidase n=1 Tax=Aquirhabdus sp. TaxID=2824160 RepID=UPI00396C8C0F